ncbi:MAG: RNA polymerase subunit sigma-70 [Deltaproteobacteria bacterium]|nr:RNA polymerase subunit sigma-70 [Deltaproteobacteria bacterium]
MVATLDAARAGDEGAFRKLVEPFRRELTAHCYRMSGSLHDAEDLAQESLLRAWRGLGSFEGRASLRTWLYRVTTRVCLDSLDMKAPRLLPMDYEAANKPFAPPRMEPVWLEPCPPELYADALSPDAAVSARESVALAFLAALQRLPARQRAVMILRDVVGYEASEVAELLEMSVAAANSALQRARDTLSKPAETPAPDASTRALLERYVRAWETADVELFVQLLHEDATLAMPPIPTWLQGAAIIGPAVRGMVLPPEANGRFKLVLAEANGLPALAAYEKRDDGSFAPASLHLLNIREGRVASIDAFMDPTLFALFGLAARL